MRTLQLAPFAVALLAALAGCSTGSSSVSGPASTSSPGTTSASATTAARTSAAASAPAAGADPITGGGLCALVSVKDADTAVHSSPAITEQEPGTFVNGEPECGYASADQSVIINVLIFNPKKATPGLSHGYMSDAPLTPVPGLGQSAAYGPPEVDVLFGTRGLVVESFGPTDASKEQMVSLAKIVVSRLS